MRIWVEEVVLVKCCEADVGMPIEISVQGRGSAAIHAHYRKIQPQLHPMRELLDACIFDSRGGETKSQAEEGTQKVWKRVCLHLLTLTLRRETSGRTKHRRRRGLASQTNKTFVLGPEVNE